MDLVTLVTACALTVDPKVMHALIWLQSSGEPWSFSVPTESQPRVFPTMQDAIREARAARPDGGRIRVGLSGVSTAPRSATAVKFAPCPNITLAARQMAQLGERCKTLPRLKADPIYCAIAAFRGSWEQPDTTFAESIKATVVKGDAPNIDMPKDAYFDASETASETLAPGPHAAPTALAVTSDDRELGWSSALFPAKPTKPVGVSADGPNRDRRAEESHSTDHGRTHPTANNAPAGSLFVPRSTERRPQ
jgi:hypothetical protein